VDRLRLPACRFLIVLAFAGVAAGGGGFPARAEDLPALRAARPPFFTCDLSVSSSAAGEPGHSVAVSIPYRELQWLRLPHGFGAGAEVMVICEPRGRGREYGDSWERRIVVAGFGATISPNAALVERRTFAVPPDRYRVRIAIRDVNSDQSSAAVQSILVPDYSKIPVGFADLDLGIVDSSRTFVASSTRRFGLEVSQLAARATLLDRRPGPWPRNYVFRYRIVDESGDDVVAGSQSVTLSRSAEPVIVRPSSSDLFLGPYTFEVALAEGRARWHADRSFEVEESGPPRGREFERLLEALSYIADAHEVEALRALPPELQARGWEEFWKRRDPTPETAQNEAMIEFFRRVRYADQHFQGAGPGWRSDMGRIYIKYGPPDQIETRPQTMQSPQLEIWYYNHPYHRFVFSDRDGFGRYVLVNPASE
jgi:GWxTD domain-containing protein